MKRFVNRIGIVVEQLTPFRATHINPSTLAKMSSHKPSISVNTENTSMSTEGTTPSVSEIPKIAAYKAVSQPTNVAALRAAEKPTPVVEPLQIKVNDSRGGFVPAYLHMSPEHDSTAPPSTAAILLSGAGGGVVGPSGIYLSMATKLAALSATVPTLRMDYRFPARNEAGCEDVLAAMEYLATAFGISKFVLVGWSFGGAPVFTVGGRDQRVVGCATVASQTAATEGIRDLAPRPVLLLHGLEDSTLSPRCSEQLYDMYGPHGDRDIKFFEGDNHALTKSSVLAEELLIRFVVKCAGTRMSESEEHLAAKEMISGEEKVTIMKQGGDLRGSESVD
jgi:dienelactone hydrolase